VELGLLEEVLQDELRDHPVDRVERLSVVFQRRILRAGTGAARREEQQKDCRPLNHFPTCFSSSLATA